MINSLEKENILARVSCDAGCVPRCNEDHRTIVRSIYRIDGIRATKDEYEAARIEIRQARDIIERAN